MKDELKKIEMKDDGKDFERFDDLLRKVISVPKEEIVKREKVATAKKATKKRKEK